MSDLSPTRPPHRRCREQRNAMFLEARLSHDKPTVTPVGKAVDGRVERVVDFCRDGLCDLTVGSDAPRFRAWPVTCG